MMVCGIKIKNHKYISLYVNEVINNEKGNPKSVRTAKRNISR